MPGCVSICVCLLWICELCQCSCCVASCFIFFFFLCLSPSPPFNSPPSFLIQHINEGQICTRGKEGVCVCVCIRAWLSALFNSVEAGWLAGAAAGKRLQRRLRLGAAIAPSYRFPHEGLPYHPSPERSPFFSHPRDTLPLFPSPPTLSLPSPPPPLPMEDRVRRNKQETATIPQYPLPSSWGTACCLSCCVKARQAASQWRLWVCTERAFNGTSC